MTRCWENARAFQAVPNTVEINNIYTLHGISVQNTFYAERPAGYVLADLVALASQLDANFGLTWLPDQPPEAAYVRTEVRGLSVENDLSASRNTNAGVGTALSPALPGQVTFSIKKTSGLTGRSARGRNYWIGIPRDKLKTTNENELETTYVTELVANVDLIRSQTELVAGWDAVLVSRFTGGEQRTTGVTFRWTGTVAVDERVDTLRNRLT